MQEKLLHFIWEKGYFDRHDLRTVAGEPIEIIHPGKANADQGPDFLDARVRIGEAEWVGHVELHVRSADWLRHGHDADRRYDNVILHVVWEHTCVIRADLPELELRGRSPLLARERYQRWMQGGRRIPCEGELRSMRLMPEPSFRDALVGERLHRKSESILQSLESAKGDWEEVFWWHLARNFGYPVNTDAFWELSRSLPIRLLGRHRGQLLQLEALLLGQSRLLAADSADSYEAMLFREHRYLMYKYGLKPIHAPVSFLRMRPANFPTLRLAQLAMLVLESERLFSELTGVPDYAYARRILRVTANDYWHYHYQPGRPSEYRPKTLGRSTIDNILINTVAPFIHAHGMHTGDRAGCEKAIALLHQIRPERNATVSIFHNEGRMARDAHDTQALLELKRSYCDHKRCLECGIGQRILYGLAETPDTGVGVGQSANSV